MEEVEVEVPTYFLCPISLQIMRDPVTLPSGITYDRESIEKWVFSDKHQTCPMTNQKLGPNTDLTPNHTLRRLIQSWCADNASAGIQRFPTPRPPLDKATILKLLDNVTRKPDVRLASLRKLREIVTYSDRNKRLTEDAGAAEVLFSIVKQCCFRNEDRTSRQELCFVEEEERQKLAGDEALYILNNLRMSEDNLRILVENNTDIFRVLTLLLRKSSYRSRTYTTLFLKSISRAVTPTRLMTVEPQLFVEITKVVSDQITQKATKSALTILSELCPWARNRVKAVEAGGVKILIDLLLDVTDKKVCEMIFVVLDHLCSCAEGREEFLQHGAGIAVVTKKIVRISDLVTERGVRILYSVVKFSSTPGLVQEMVQLGAVSKLCLVLHVDCGTKTKARAKEILKLHSRSWKNSPCVAPQLLSLYPN